MSSDYPYYSSNSVAGEHSVDASPDIDIENVSISSSTGSKLYDYIVRPFFSALNNQGSIQATRFGEIQFQNAGTAASAPSTVTSKKSNPMHRKTKSCSQIMESESAAYRLPKYVETPEISTVLRVQPHGIRVQEKFLHWRLEIMPQVGADEVI